MDEFEDTHRQKTLEAFFDFENKFFKEPDSSMPLEQKISEIYGALALASKSEAIDWETVKSLLGDFVIKACKL